MFYFVYKTTCIVTNKIYYGVHKTTDINDGYIGSGKYLKRAISKYGIENFTREIIKFHNSHEEAFIHEKEIVTPDFVLLDSNYNFKPGGSGGDTLQKRCWYNNGLVEKYYSVDDVPEGWIKGRLSTCVFKNKEKQKEFAAIASTETRKAAMTNVWASGKMNKRDNTKCGTTAEDNPSSKAIVTPNGRFVSINDAMISYGRCRAWIKKQLIINPEEWYYD